jgi:hypothetical protein
MTARAAETASPPAFHLDAIEIGPIGYVIVGIELTADKVPGFELDELVRPSTNRFQVVRGFARLST